MSRQSSRNNRRIREKEGNRYRVAVILVALIVLVGGGVMYVGWAKRSAAQQSFIAKVNTWWVERKARIASKLVKSHEKTSQPTVASSGKSSEPESLHFEFYNMLPNHDATMTVESTEAKSAPIFSQDSLERELAQEVKKTAFIIQTGIYSNAASANKIRQELAEEGLASKVVKAYMDEHLVYRVQVGPYQEKDKISDAQSKLAARGIHCVLRKSEEKLA